MWSQQVSPSNTRDQEQKKNAEYLWLYQKLEYLLRKGIISQKEFYRGAQRYRELTGATMHLSG